MSERFLGVPLAVWGGLCLLVAVVWLVVWPADRAAGAAGVRLFLIRWGHALTWGLLAGMCFIRAGGNAAAVAWSGPVGLAALLAYLAFIAATFVGR